MKVVFPKESDSFLKDVQQEVHTFLHENGINKSGNNGTVMRYLFLLSLLIVNYITIIQIDNLYLSLACYSFFGPLFIVMALNVSHDAAHGVAHSNKYLNSFFALQMDLTGPNSFTWKRRHKIGHHTFPNVLDKDPDLKQTKIARIFPNAKKYSFHKFQHLYIPLLYSIYTINWIYVRDFYDFFSKKSIIGKIPRAEYLKLFLFKTLYIIVFFIIPMYFSSLTMLQVVLGNLLMHVFGSYFLTIALVPSHVSYDSVFPLPNEKGVMPYSWSHHQVITTSDFATNSKLVTFLFGGFNHHIVHHLFPMVSHIHYAKLTPIVKNVILKYNLPYKHVDSIIKAYKSHYLLLKNNGKQA